MHKGHTPACSVSNIIIETQATYLAKTLKKKQTFVIVDLLFHNVTGTGALQPNT